MDKGKDLELIPWGSEIREVQGAHQTTNKVEALELARSKRRDGFEVIIRLLEVDFYEVSWGR